MHITHYEPGSSWGRSISPQNYKESLQTDVSLQLVSFWRLLKVCDRVWGSTKGHVCEAMNFLRQAMIPEREAIFREDN